MKYLPMVLSICFLLLSGFPARAGFLITGESRSNIKDFSETYPVHVVMEGDKMKIDMTQKEKAGKGNSEEMIFRGDQGIMLYVNHGTKIYSQMDGKTIAEMQSQMTEAMKRMEEEMKKLTPEQREMMKGMIGSGGKGLGGAAGKKPPKEIVKNGETKSINGMKCVRYDVMRGSEKIDEIWVASWGDAGIKKGDLSAFENMFKFQEKMNETLKANPMLAEAGQGSISYYDLDKLNGYPVLIKSFRNGALSSETTLNKPQAVDVDPGIFELPKGYTKAETGIPAKAQAK